MAIRKTARGFRIFAEFKDDYGTPFNVVESSSVDPHCWIYYNDPEYGKWHLGEKLPPALHLSPAQARRLIRALERWLATV